MIPSAMMNGAQRKCVFCGGPANSREHVFAKRLCQRAQVKKMAVIAGIYTEGEGIKNRGEHLLDTLTVRHVCATCNNGWMNELEDWFETRLGHFIQPEWPRLAENFLEMVRPESDKLAQWLIKTAVTYNLAAVKGKLKVEFPPEVLSGIMTGKIPDYCWVDLGYSRLSTVGAGIGKCFRTINGGQYQYSQIFSGFGFSFIVQFNHLLLRIANAPKADVVYDPSFGGRPVRLYPTPDSRIIIPEYADFMKFQHSVVLRTWFGCKGNIPQQAGMDLASNLIT